MERTRTAQPRHAAAFDPGSAAAPRVSARRRALLALATAAFAVLGCFCIDVGRHSMAVTFDEPNHLAAGLEWWQFGSYRQWTENPPLARIAVAALPYLHGQRLPAPEAWDPSLTYGDQIWVIGGNLSYEGDGVEANLARARLGTLPFYLLGLLAVWGLAGGRQRPGSALVAVGLTSTLPSLLAHGALATTDVAFTATFLLAVLALWRWFEAASFMRSVALGAALALALLAKLTTLSYFPAVVVAFVAARAMARLPRTPCTPAALLRALAVVGLTTAMVTWAGYGFSVGRIADLPARVGRVQILPPPSERSALERAAFEVPVPMPELAHGLLFLIEHGRSPPPAYLLGRVSNDGFLEFYPVVLAVKTPLPFLAALLAAGWLLARRWRSPQLWLARAVLLGALGVVAVAMIARFNLGLRHVLVALPLAAVAIGRACTQWIAEPHEAHAARQPVLDAGVSRLGEPRRVPPLLVASALALLLAWQAGIAFAARSTELGYFNAFAADDPAGVLLDSDLDWGQDVYALRREARARGIERLTIAYFGVARLCGQGLPVLEPLRPGRPTTGWIAISENFYRHRNYFTLLENPCDPESWIDARAIAPQPFAWLRAHTPVAIVGSSIRLYFIPAGSEPEAREP